MNYLKSYVIIFKCLQFINILNNNKKHNKKNKIRYEINTFIIRIAL